MLLFLVHITLKSYENLEQSWKYWMNKNNKDWLSSSDVSIHNMVNPILGEKINYDGNNCLPSELHELSSRLYYKNLLILDEDFNNTIFEIFEPVIESHKSKALSDYEPINFKYGIEHIIIDSSSARSNDHSKAMERSHSSLVRNDHYPKSRMSSKMSKISSNPFGVQKESKVKVSPLKLYKFKKKKELWSPKRIKSKS